MQIVNQPVRKKDAMQLVTGQPVYMDDMIPEDCLIVKLLRSPHANAVVQEIQTDKAMKVPGIEAIYTWKDIDQNGRRFTCAGQTYPEPSPYDRLILDRHVRFVGDPVIFRVHQNWIIQSFMIIKDRFQHLVLYLDHGNGSVHRFFCLSCHNRNRVSYKSDMTIQNQTVIWTGFWISLSCTCKSSDRKSVV